MMVAPARDTPGDHRYHLAEADRERGPSRHLLDRVMAGLRQVALDDQDRDAAQHQRGDDHPRIEQVGLDETVRHRADHHGRQEREQDVAHEAELLGVMAKAGRGAREAAEILPAHRADRAQLDDDLEYLTGRGPRKPIRSTTRIRCPVEETGRNSVRPSITPSRRAPARTSRSMASDGAQRARGDALAEDGHDHLMIRALALHAAKRRRRELAHGPCRDNSGLIVPECY